MRTSTFIIAGAFALSGCASSPEAEPTTAETQPIEPSPTEAEQAPVAESPEAASPSPADAQSDPMMGGGMGSMAQMCPMAVQGTQVSAKAEQASAVLVFTTDGDVAELRRRVTQMAEMYNRHQSGEGGMMMRMHRHMQGAGMHGAGMHGAGMHGAGMHGAGMQGGGMQGAGKQGGMMMPPSTAEAEEIDGGARLVLTARDENQQQTLQQHVDKMAERMNSHECPMMSSGTSATSPSHMPPSADEP